MPSPTKFLTRPVSSQRYYMNYNNGNNFDTLDEDALIRNLTEELVLNDSDSEVFDILHNQPHNGVRTTSHFTLRSVPHAYSSTTGTYFRPEDLESVDSPLIKPVPVNEQRLHHTKSSPWTKSAEHHTPEKNTPPQPFSLHFAFPSVFQYNQNQQAGSMLGNGFTLFSQAQSQPPQHAREIGQQLPKPTATAPKMQQTTSLAHYTDSPPFAPGLDFLQHQATPYQLQNHVPHQPPHFALFPQQNVMPQDAPIYFHQQQQQQPLHLPQYRYPQTGMYNAPQMQQATAVPNSAAVIHRPPPPAASQPSSTQSQLPVMMPMQMPRSVAAPMTNTVPVPAPVASAMPLPMPKPTTAAPQATDEHTVFNQRHEIMESPVSKMKYKDFARTFKMKEKEGYEAARDFAIDALQYLPEKIKWRVYMDIAELAKRENIERDARYWFKQVNTKQPYASQGWLEYAKMEEESGNLDRCREILAMGLSFCPRNESLIVKNIKHNEQMNNLPASRALLARLQHEAIDKIWKTVLEGALLEARSGNIDIARKIFKYLMNNIPRHGPIYYEAYRFEEKCEDFEKALEIVERGLTVNPRYGPLWFALFYLLEKLAVQQPSGTAGAAAKPTVDLTKIRDAVARASTSISKELIWKVYFEAAQIEERHGNLEQAKAMYVKSVLHSLSNLRWKVWLAGARTELNANNTAVARLLLNRALAEVPNKTRAVVLIECARLEEYTGNLDKARTILQRAQKETKHEWKVFLESILLEMRAGDTQRAIQEAEASLKIHPGTGRLWAVLIQLKYKEGEEEQMRIFKKALKEVPKSGEVWCEGARIRLNPLSANFNLAEAEQYLEFAVRFTPQYGDSFIEYLRLELLTQGPEPADTSKLNLEQLCVNADPNYGPLWFHCKQHPLDSTRQVLRRAKLMLSTHLNTYRSLYQHAILSSSSAATSATDSLNKAELIAMRQQEFESRVSKYNVNPEDFITGLPLPIIATDDLEERRKLIFGADQISI